MQNVQPNFHALRSAGWSVLCYIGVLIVATFITSPLAPPTNDPARLMLLLEAHRSTLLLGAWLSFPAAAFFLWFLVGFREYLRGGTGRQEGLATLVLITGVVMTTLELLAASLESLVAYVPSDVFQAGGFAAVYATFLFVQVGLGYAPVSIFCFAAGHSMRRHQTAPAWLAWLGYLAGVGTAIASLSIFYVDPTMSPTGAGSGALGALPTAIFLIATGIVLLRTPDQPGSVDTGPTA